MGPSLNLISPSAIGLKGFFELEAFKGEYVYDEEGEHICGDNGLPIVYEYLGTRRVVVDWFPNQMLDVGRNIMATSSNWAGAASKCQVGGNNTPSLSTDTQLLGFVAGTAVTQVSSKGAQASTPYYGWDQQTYRFAEGAAQGNLSEVGVGWDVIDGPYLITRALIVDGSDNPTTATVLSDEWLDVTYQLRYYPPLEDVEGTVTLNGTVYDTLTRASAVNAVLGDNIGILIGQLSPGVSSWVAYDGNIGSMIQAPSGASANCDNDDQFNLAYSNNSYRIDMQCDCGITGWNLGAGIRSIRGSTTAGNFQTQFDAQSGGATIPKTVDFTMSMVWRVSWAGWYWAYGYSRQASHDSTTPTTGNWNTNTAETLLRINWDDSGATDRQIDLQLESNSLFRITEDAARENWAQYRVQAAYTEGGDYTYYTVVVESSQNGGPTVGQACTITAVDY